MHTDKFYQRYISIAIAGYAMVLTGIATLPAAAQGITSYTPVTEARLLKPEPENWLHYRGNFEGWGYSPLDKITAKNVRRLQPVWSMSTGVVEGHQSPPFVNNGIMFVTTPGNQVLALNAKTGDLIWRYKRELPEDIIQSHPTNRGVGLHGNKVFLATLDAFVIALDARTGKVLWETRVDDYKRAYYFTLAPLVAKGKVMVGTSGGEFGIRGYVAALDAETGKEVWRTYTIPGPGEPGGDTWKDGKERYKHGGGSVWETATYDHETDTFYQGIGNAGPDWDPEYRPGDNKWAASVLALSPSDGKIKWGYQYTPNDPYDFDEISEHQIINAKVNGEDRKLVVHVARNGFYYALDRTNGSFILGKQYVDQLNWTPGLDPKTGRPLNYNPNTDVQEYNPRSHSSRANPKSDRLCPSHYGGKNWEPAAYNPELNLLYVPSIEGCNTLETVEQKDFEDQGGPVKWRERFTGGGGRPSERLYGSLKAIDPTTGETKVRLKLEYPNYSGALATAGNLVFLGHYDGTFSAYDAKTLQEVWSFNVGTGINAPPVTYSVNGKQYVAVLVGSRQPLNVWQNAPELKNTATASMLYVFSQ